jgi:hypothetical protein
MKPDPANVEALVQRMLASLEEHETFSASEFLSAAFTLVSRAAAACVQVSLVKSDAQRMVSDQFARLTLKFMPEKETRQ